MISSTNTTSLNERAALHPSTSPHGEAAVATGGNTTAKARAPAISQAALQAASNTHKADSAEHALETRQTALADDLRAAMRKAGVGLSGAVEFSMGSDGKVGIQGADADKTATTKFLDADPSRPSFATRIATQAKDALRLSATIRQSAAISQAARHGGKAAGVMSLYTSLMQSSGSATAVFAVSVTGSSLSYPGSLATKA